MRMIRVLVYSGSGEWLLQVQNNRHVCGEYVTPNGTIKEYYITKEPQDIVSEFPPIIAKLEKED